MLLKQISVFVENKKGRLAVITKAIAEADVDIFAISIADTTNYGILRMIVDKPELAKEVIEKIGCTVNLTDVIAVEVPDKHGELNNVLTLLDKEDISVEYIYSFLRTRKDTALILFRVETPEKAIEVLEKNNINTLNQKMISEI